jgi:hypothetical protein
LFLTPSQSVLQDLIQDVQYPNLTSKLKQNARQNFETVIKYFPNAPFSLSINSVSNNEFQESKYLIDQFEPDKIHCNRYGHEALGRLIFANRTQ